MPKVFERDQRLGSVVQYEEQLPYGRSRKIVTVNEAAETKYEIGRVIGDDNDTMALADGFVGIYVGSPEGANSQVVAAGEDTEVVVIFRDAGVGDKNLVFAADVTDGANREAALAKIEAAGIQVIKQV